ncbi:hypothetical protein ACWD64_35865 [Streptomyces antibioticus]
MRQSSPSLSTPPSPTLRSRTGAMIGFMVLLELTSGIDQGMFPTLLPTIGEPYGVGAGSLVWVSAAPAAVSVTVLAGLGDRYGHRRMLRIAAACTLVASILLVVAPTYELFLVRRLLLTRWPPGCRWRSPSSATGSPASAPAAQSACWPALCPSASPSTDWWTATSRTSPAASPSPSSSLRY